MPNYRARAPTEIFVQRGMGVHYGLTCHWGASREEFTAGDKAADRQRADAVD
jgi:hypothetical protein